MTDIDKKIDALILALQADPNNPILKLRLGLLVALKKKAPDK